VEVQESRRRVISAGDTERRRIERNLHDGAQQRLLALALELRHALDRDNEDWAQVLSEAIDDLQLAVQELRDLVSGLHPTLLVEEGLAAAIEAVADRLTIRVRVSVPDKRLPADIEAALYYVACEGIANAVKHAGASEITVRGENSARVVILEVLDDGRGGAKIEGGGLRGLADRIDALGGRLTVDSPAVGGTVVRAVIPCAS
jgi:signal transduction histidine kinase